MKGIDVSKWNGAIRWDLVKKEGIEFAILKIIDKQGRTESAFEQNYAGVSSQMLSVGVYNYSYADTVERAKKDAKKVLYIMGNRAAPCKIWLDVEDQVQKGLGKNLISIIRFYQDIIETGGYEFGVYTGLSFYESFIRPYALELNCPFWIARYPTSKSMTIKQQPSLMKKPIIQHSLWGWQYSSKGKVLGVRGNVDLNILYRENIDENIKNPYEEPVETLYRSRQNMVKAQVQWLQYELNEMGYGLEVDGIFGQKTDFAVKDAQKRMGILVDGKCGKVTKEKLKNRKF